MWLDMQQVLISRYIWSHLCGLCGVWGPNVWQIHTPGDTLLGLISEILSISPYQVMDKFSPQCRFHWHKECPNPEGYVLVKMILLLGKHWQDDIGRLGESSWKYRQALHPQYSSFHILLYLSLFGLVRTNKNPYILLSLTMVSLQWWCGHPCCLQ